MMCYAMCAKRLVPSHLQDLCLPVTTVSTRAALRSAARGDLVVPRTRRRLGILRRRSYSVEQLAVRHSNCFFCHNFQESTQDSFIYPVILHNIISSVRLYGALAVTLWTCYGAL